MVVDCEVPSQEAKYLTGSAGSWLVLGAMLLASCGKGNHVPFTGSVQGASTLQQQIAAGGVVLLPRGTINVDCSSQLVVNKDASLEGQGPGLTIIDDSCPTGNTITVTAGDVQIERLAIVHKTSSGSGIRFTGGPPAIPNVPPPDPAGINSLREKLVIKSVVVSGAYNCLVSEGINLLSVYESKFKDCLNDGAVIGSFGVTLHDNWFSANGHNGVSFIGAGFCAACTGNEYWSNKVHGIQYSNPPGNIDPRHIGEYVDNNSGVGLVIDGFIRDFTFNDGWIGSNGAGGAVIPDSLWGTVIVGNTFVYNKGPALVITETSGPLRLSGNISSHPYSGGCDAIVNGACVNINQ